MKLVQIINEMCAKKTTEEEEVMTAAEIESGLDDIQAEFGDNPKVKIWIGKVTRLLLKKDLVGATKEMEKLMDYIRSITD